MGELASAWTEATFTMDEELCRVAEGIADRKKDRPDVIRHHFVPLVRRRVNERLVRLDGAVVYEGVDAPVDLADRSEDPL